MTDAAFMFVEPKNIGDGNQLTLENGICKLTVMASPEEAVVGSGLTVISLSLTVIPPLDR